MDKFRKTVVWALFDDGNQSVHNTLKDDEQYNVISIGIQDKDTVTKIDLSQNWEELKKQLSELPSPDIIVASPVCSSFSKAACLAGGNATWRIDGDKITLRPESDYIGTRYNAQRQINNGKLGIALIDNTINIINHFKPKFWYIENPASSLIWKVVNGKLDSHDNVADYCMYGLEWKKPTRFLSNIDLNLKKCDNTHTPIIQLCKWFKQKVNYTFRTNQRHIQWI